MSYKKAEKHNLIKVILTVLIKYYQHNISIYWDWTSSTQEGLNTLLSDTHLYHLIPLCAYTWIFFCYIFQYWAGGNDDICWSFILVYKVCICYTVLHTCFYLSRLDKSKYSGLWYHVVLWKDTNILGLHLPGRRRQPQHYLASQPRSPPLGSSLP